jgi:hypothetical protein
MAGFWTKKREQAALDVAQDLRTDDEIAAAAGVSRQSLENWKARPDFGARVQEHITSFAEAIKVRGIAERQNRVDALNARWDLMQQVITERGADASLEGVPGGKTGLLVRQVKSIGFGENNQTVEEYAVDTGLLRELRAHEQQAAEELGQWIKKADVTSGGKKMAFTLRIDRGDEPDTGDGDDEAA